MNPIQSWHARKFIEQKKMQAVFYFDLFPFHLQLRLPCLRVNMWKSRQIRGDENLFVYDMRCIDDGYLPYMLDVVFVLVVDVSVGALGCFILF